MTRRAEGAVVLPKMFFKTSKYAAVLFSALVVLFLIVSCASAPRVEDVNKADTHYKIGVSYLAKDQLKEAFVEFQKAIKLNPKNKDSLNALGLISTEFKEYGDAVTYYKRAISIAPDYPEAMNNLGVTYVKMEEWDEAIKYFKMALKNPLYLNPERAYSNMGYTFYRKGDYHNAMHILKKAITRYPDFLRPIYFLGLVYLKLGETGAAIEEFKKVVNLAPENIDAHWELANAYLRTGDGERAVKHFKVVAKSGADNDRREEAFNYIELLRK